MGMGRNNLGANMSKLYTGEYVAKSQGKTNSWRDSFFNTIFEKQIKGRKFKLEEVPIKRINRSSYWTVKEAKAKGPEYHLTILGNLIEAFNSGMELPPVVLDENYFVLDGAHRVGALKYLKYDKVKAFVRIKN